MCGESCKHGVGAGNFDTVGLPIPSIENKQKFISQIMSSKSPVRSCEDVDETALSYAEIKALCAGNPLIREKMDLDIEVARLRLLKADYQSQHYRLEDNLLKRFPEGIKQEESAIVGYKADIQCLANETNLSEDGFSQMEIHGVTYDEKGLAGAALLEAFKTITTTEPHKIGNYRGFEMSLSYSIMYKEYTMTLKGNMSYSVDLGNDVFGNIARIDNLLKSMPERLSKSEAQLENLHQQVKNARLELDTPFQFELELSEKSERLAALDTELNMDKSGSEALDLDDDIESKDDFEPKDYAEYAKPDVENKGSGKTSILDGLKNKPVVGQSERTDKEKIAACI